VPVVETDIMRQGTLGNWLREFYAGISRKQPGSGGTCDQRGIVVTPPWWWGSWALVAWTWHLMWCLTIMFGCGAWTIVAISEN